MPTVTNSSQSLGSGYPRATGRLKEVTGKEAGIPTKIALVGDSTLDNDVWVDENIPYAQKTHTVTHQTALALAKISGSHSSYTIGLFAVDGATTRDVMSYCELDKVLAADEGHPQTCVNQLIAVTQWKPDVVVVSVAGNNYREALARTLQSHLSEAQLLLRTTPEEIKAEINEAFKKVKETILKEYKLIIDELIRQNPDLKRIVLMSQYFPSITEFTPYFIYTGFSHLARAEGKGKTPFNAVEETMNELYRDILAYVATKDKEIVFVDVTSSLNPLGGKHTLQIEPNEEGAKIMGRLIAKAVTYDFPSQSYEQGKRPIARIYMTANEKSVLSTLLEQKDIPAFQVKTIERFIRENRYRHAKLLFSSSSSLRSRYEQAYHLIMGKQFDSQYTGLFAFGLLDASLVTVMASYLWRVAINDKVHLSLRVAAGTAAAPVLTAKMVAGLSLMLALAVPIYGGHQVSRLVAKLSHHEEKDGMSPTI